MKRASTCTDALLRQNEMGGMLVTQQERTDNDTVETSNAEGGGNLV